MAKIWKYIPKFDSAPGLQGHAENEVGQVVHLFFIREIQKGLMACTRVGPGQGGGYNFWFLFWDFSHLFWKF